MSLLETSDALHARVKAFAAGDRSWDFEALALAIARFQAEYCPGFRRLVARHGSKLDRIDSIPAVPVDAFRVARVAAHPASEDSVRFFTSGTTANQRGMHAMRTTETYRCLAIHCGAAALTRWTKGPRIVVALARKEIQNSSLAFMMAAFMQEFDGRSLDERRESRHFSVDEPGRWLLGPQAVAIAGLERALALARRRQEPLLVLATSFALVALLDDVGQRRFSAPADTVVMQTGGYKGKGRRVDPEQLRRGVAQAFGILPARVVGEYGMTELTSQLYEDTLPGGIAEREPGVYYPPPWLSATPVDPVTLEPMQGDQVGLARFVDLGNVDSAVVIVTQDQIRRRGAGIELLGRAPKAEARGCSLAVEDLFERLRS